jgi:hypothetical protein
MANLNSALATAMQVNGAVAAAVVDLDSGMALGTTGGGGINLDVAAAGNTEVLRSKMRTMKDLGLEDEIEDILLTLGSQYHIIRPIKTKGSAGLFLYFVLDRSKANLAMARHKLTEIEKNISI